MMALIGIAVSVVAVSVAPAELAMRSPAPHARVVVEAPGASALRLWASAGSLSPARQVGPGRFEATYVAPTSGRPMVAAIAAWDPVRQTAGRALIALDGRTELPVTTDPGTQVEVTAGGRRATARADGAGNARVVLWVAPGVTRVRVAALNSAGNTTVKEVPLEVPPAARIWLVAPAAAAAGHPISILAVSLAEDPPVLHASTGILETESSGPGVTVAQLVAARPARVTARSGEERATATVEFQAVAAPSVTVAQRPARQVWELGAAVEGRFADVLDGFAGVVKARRRLGRSRIYVGCDALGIYAAGSTGGSDLTLGGAELAVAGELRFAINPALGWAVGASAGGGFARVHRLDPVGLPRSSWDGAPALAGRAEAWARIGRGILTMAVGYEWMPLMGLQRVNAGGVLIALGYSFGL